MNNLNKKRGLSLVEILITMAILGVIVLASSSVITSFTNIHEKERKIMKSERKMDEVLNKIRKDADDSEQTDVSLSNYGKVINKIIFFHRVDVPPVAPKYELKSKIVYIRYTCDTTTHKIKVEQSDDLSFSNNIELLDEIDGFNVDFKIKQGVLADKNIIIISLSSYNKGKKIRIISETAIIGSSH